jgi:hypothetical protein
MNNVKIPKTDTILVIPDQFHGPIQKKSSGRKVCRMLVAVLVLLIVILATCFFGSYMKSTNSAIKPVGRDNSFLAYANTLDHPIVVNAASTASLGSSDCPDVPNQTLANMGHLAGAPKGPDGAVPCGKKMTLLKDGKSTTVTIAWQATGVFSGNPNNEPYVEIFPEAYTELTGNQVIDGVFWQEGSFKGGCTGTCNSANA